MFQQTLVPIGNLFVTVLVAFVPLVLLLFMLAGLRMSAWKATIIAGAVTALMGIVIWHTPADQMAKAYLYGGLQGAWAINWITFWGLILFNTLILTGEFDKFKNWIVHHATNDIRIQTLMLAWAFGALLEGLVGFGYPWAVIAPILIGFGLKDLDAIRVAALANNAPVSYGALGAPIITLATVTGLPLMAVSGGVGNIVAILALAPPWILLYLVSGRKGMLEAWPLAIIGSLAYIAGQWPVARYVGPYLPDVTGALVCFFALFAFTKVWRPAVVRGPGGVPIGSAFDAKASGVEAGSALRAWAPYIVLIVIVVAWTGPWAPRIGGVILPSYRVFQLSISAISSVTGMPAASAFNFTPFSGGTAVLVTWLVILAMFRPSGAMVRQVFSKTFHQMWGALLVGFFIFGLAYAFVFSGMANSMAKGCAELGPAFIVLAPILGWVGVALSGSNTSTNAMFGPVQMAAGTLLGLPPLMLPAFNSVGAEVGKPIAPQTASVGVSTSKFVRSEGDVIRHNMGWTLILLAYLIVIAVVVNWFFPEMMVI